MYKFDLRCKGKDNLPYNNELTGKILILWHNLII